MPTWLGIDIGSASVKVALVRSTYRKLAVSRVATTDIVSSDGVAAAVRAAVTEVVGGHPGGGDAVAVAVDGRRVAVHNLRLPAAAGKQLAEVLSFELEAQVPFDLDGSVFDWIVLDREGDSGELAIIAAVARVEDVRFRIELVREAINMEPERVAVGAFALAALADHVGPMSEHASVAIVDLGANASDVLILERGQPVFARTVSTGTGGLPEAAGPLARDITLSVAAHRAQGGNAPEHVYLCGGGAFASGAESFLSGALNLPVHVMPAPSLDLTDLDASEVAGLPRYAKAVALALSLAGRGSGLNLRRGPLVFERGFAWVRERIPVLAGLLSVIAVSFMFSAWARFHVVSAERRSLEGALASVTQEVLGTRVSTASDAQELLAKEAALNDEDPMPHADAFDIMVRLSDAVPPSMKHDIEELSVQKGHILVRGVVGSIPDAQSIQATLAEDRCLSDVKLKSTTQAVGSDRQKYLLEFELKCPEDIKPVSKKKGESAAAGSALTSSSGGK